MTAGENAARGVANYLMKQSIPIIVSIFLTSAVGCGKTESSRNDSTERTVYFDSETKAIVVAPRSQEEPAVNPRTGKRTLQKALYCDTCKRWYPAPPLEIRQRNPNAGKCRKDGTKLTAQGPLPKQ